MKYSLEVAPSTTISAHAQLATENFDYGFVVRDYQQRAILKTEAGIAEGKRAILLAMATGTGKTKTCIALIYRLLKTKRFRRILFLVDRSALGEQAANAFKDTRMESLQSFADTFGIKEIDEASPDTATAVHIATIQGMVARVLNPSEGVMPPTVDQYDCIIVDECHRGYLLDRELSDTEMSFRSYDDYISKYRRVLDYFDAVKIGLTATPALHTTEIFGPPIYTYSYREAVIDGHLIDHEPPVTIKTELSEKGIVWKKGEDVQVYKNKDGAVELFKAPDEIKIEVDNFNKKVITESFNRVVCDYLAGELDPASRKKTLIFCATDVHADLVVDLLKKAFVKVWGSVDDDAVIKITGAADKPLKLLRRYKNERNPNVAVTVDLLTTGIDVPEICNLVFLRRVNSRILFDQMLGRATRQCDDIGKDTFRIYDAVRLYDALENLTAMKPVVVDPTISFTQLAQELTTVGTEEARSLVRDQFISKLQRKKRHLSERAASDFEAKAGMTPDEFVKHLQKLPLDQVAAWFLGHQDLGEILDRKSDGPSNPVFISGHEDKFIVAERGYGAGKKPEDYLQEFKTFIQTQGNKLPALITVVIQADQAAPKGGFIRYTYPQLPTIFKIPPSNIGMSIWLIRAGSHGEFEPKFLEENRVYVTWLNLAHDLHKLENRDALISLLETLDPGAKPKKLQNHAGQIWPFAQTMQKGDWVVLPLKTQQSIYIGEITSDYHFEPKGPNPFYHWRSVKWIGEAIPRQRFGQDLLHSFGAFLTICRIQRNNV